MDILKNISNISNIVVNYLKIKNLLKKDDKNKIDIKKETDKIVNDEIENKNNTRLSDAIRKEKQMKIESFKKVCIVFCVIILSGCSLFKDPIKTEITNSYDINSLKITDKTYRLVDTQNVKVYDADISTNYYFSTDWFIVYKDFLKTYNENQNYILELQDIKQQKDKIYKIISDIIPYCIGAIIGILILIISKLLKKR